MTAVIVLGAVFLLFALLLCCSVAVEASYEEELTADLRFLFLHYRIQPKPEKKQSEEELKKKEKQPPEKKPSKLKTLFQQKGFWGFLELLQDFSRVAYTSAKKILSHIVIKFLFMDITVGGEDAAQTALNYGKTCGVVTTALTALRSTTKCKKQHVQVNPDFQNGDHKVRFRVRFQVRLFFLLSGAFSALIGFIKVYLKSKKESGNSDLNKKAVL